MASLLEKMAAAKAAHDAKLASGESTTAKPITSAKREEQPNTPGAAITSVKCEELPARSTPIPASSPVLRSSPSCSPEPENHQGGYVFKDGADRKRLWEKYQSTFKPHDGIRRRRVNRCPDDVLARIHTGADKSFWFPIWCKHQDWAKAEYQEVLSIVGKDLDVGECEWLTEAQVIELVKSPVVGSAICAVKRESSKTCRQHPDVPHLEEARQYLVSPM